MEKKNIPKGALSLSKGVKQPPSVNPNYYRKKRPDFTDSEYIEGILNGDRIILSRAITIIESNLPADMKQAQKIIEACLPYTGKSIRIGITGVPGVGKSMFIESIGTYLIQSGHKLAVLAIDPSSERSKGSILGDKTRMENLSSQANAFIRPSSSSGTLGGVARKTRESILLCEAAGYDIIFVETVGVGQSETTVRSMVDFFLLLMLSGAGDELQGIKRGIMEMADMFVITKADGLNAENAQRAAAEYKSAIHMFPMPESEWIPRVLTCSSLKNIGMEQIWAEIMDYKNHTSRNNFFNTYRNRQSLYWMNETIKDTLNVHFYGDTEIQEQLTRMQDDVLQNKISPFTAAQNILNSYFNRKM